MTYVRTKEHKDAMSLKLQGKNKGKNIGNQYYKLRNPNNIKLVNSQFKKGMTPWNKGYGDYIKGEKNPRFGKVGSDISKKLWDNPDFRDKTIKAILKGLIKRPTSLEKTFIELIQKHNLPYKYTGDGSYLMIQRKKY